MKNITLSADEELIDAAREKARAERTTLNQAFRDWLAEYVERPTPGEEVLAIIKRLQGRIDTSGIHLTHAQMNER